MMVVGGGMSQEPDLSITGGLEPDSHRISVKFSKSDEKRTGELRAIVDGKLNGATSVDGSRDTFEIGLSGALAPGAAVTVQHRVGDKIAATSGDFSKSRTVR